MDAQEFEKILNNQLDTICTMLSTKAKEYADNTDRLHNFKVAADLQGCSNIRALGGMMVKHTVSIYDMIASDKAFTVDVWDEKITDHINYLILLRACIVDKAVD